MNRFEKFWLSNASKKLVVELANIDNWKWENYTLENKNLPDLKLWVCNGWQFCDIIIPGTSSDPSGLIPYLDRYIIWKYIKHILHNQKMNVIDKIFNSVKSN